MVGRQGINAPPTEKSLLKQARTIYKVVIACFSMLYLVVSP